MQFPVLSNLPAGKEAAKPGQDDNQQKASAQGDDGFGDCGGLVPILIGTGSGSEIMSRIAAPMVGGMITAPLLSMFLIPAAFKLMWSYTNRKRNNAAQ